MARGARGLGGALRGACVSGCLGLAACGGSGADAVFDDSAITDIPTTGPRNQKETGNCWLYATAAWAESLESQASAREGRPPATHWSVAYWDYWDWYDKITGGKVHGSDPKKVASELDSGGSWGAAAELMLERGLVHETDFLSDAPLADANAVTKAVATMAASLTSGPLAARAARTDGALVRSELERAFQLRAEIATELSRAFGDDGSRTLLTTGRAEGPVNGPSSVRILSPRPSGEAVVRTLRDAIGVRASAGGSPDRRSGPEAWSYVGFGAKTPAQTRAFEKRLQRALDAGAPVPLDWYWASGADPNDLGVFHRVTSVPDDDPGSVYHETLLYDYEVTVPGLGTLRAGEPATDAEKSAALADDAVITFLRVKDSYYGYRTATDRHAGQSDLYVDYLLGAVHACSHGVQGTRTCEDIVPLDGAYLPPGF